MKAFEFKAGRAYLLRLDFGADIILQLTEFLKSSGVKSALVSGIGAVISAEVGYYDQIKKEYVRRKVEERCEILSLSGNISIKDGEVFPHIHIILGNEDKIFSGHLFRSEVFACELFVLELVGKPPERKFDNQTGLYLW
jgi:hypothetical protein